MFENLDVFDPSATVAAARGRVQAEIAAGCELLELAAHWADLHPGDQLARPSTPRQVGERAMALGGDGTPEVAEFAPAELAPEIGLSVYQATALLADALDLRHRFPRAWRRVQRGEVTAWRVRQLARRTRQISRQDAAVVDRMLADRMATLSKGRLDDRIDAAMLRANPDRAKRLADEAARERLVHVAQSTEFGTRAIYARLDAGDAAWLNAMINRLADILTDARRRGRLPAGVPDRDPRSRPEWRALALAVLAQPVLAAKLLLEASSGTGAEQPTLADAGDQRPAVDQPATGAGSESTSAVIERAHRDAFACWLQKVDPRTLGPDVTLHVHISDSSLSPPTVGSPVDPSPVDPSPVGLSSGGTGDGHGSVARVEGIGPVLLSQVQRWLGSGCRVRLLPVLDPAGIAPVDCYETPARMAEGVRTIFPVSAFPYGNTPSRGADLDHSIAYRSPPDRPPGQTRIGNLAPLNRREHRYRTFGRIRLRQPVPGTCLWRTPYGRVLVVTDSETFDVGTGEFAAALWAAFDQVPVAQPAA